MKKVILALSSLFFVGCTKIGLDISNIPTSFTTHKIVTDIAYGEKEIQKLDIYIPQNIENKKLPVIVFFYGGRWTDGTKEMYAFVGEKFANENYILVMADYSKYPQVKFPTFVQDAAKAVAWTHDHINQYGGNADRLYVSGHSSGAHMGSLVAANVQYLKAEGKSTKIIKAFAGLAGPYDFIPQAEDLKDLFGPPKNYPQMQTTHFITGNQPPMLLLWGDADTIVWQRNIDLLTKEIQEKGGIVKRKIYPDMGHVGIISNMTWWSTNKTTVIEDIITFFEAH